MATAPLSPAARHPDLLGGRGTPELTRARAGEVPDEDLLAPFAAALEEPRR